MSLETYNKDEDLMWPSTIIAGASTLVLNDESDFVLPSISLNPKAISIQAGIAKSIEIEALCTEPLVIDCRAEQAIDIIIKEGADVQILLENSLSSQINIVLKDKAKACFYLLKGSRLEMSVKVNESASFTLFDIKTSLEKSLHTIDIELAQKEAEVSYFGLDLLHGLAHKKTHLIINHRAEKTKSAQSFRGIYAGASEGSFLGKVVIEKNAGLSAASQLYRSVILSEKAKAHTMPQLEIYNYDIKASHGASIGELDCDILFYLCSRGLSLKDAKSLAIKGLINDILDQVKEEAFKRLISQIVERAALLSIEDA